MCRSFFSVLVFPLIALAGCGAPGAKVTGKVTADGNPVPGTIQFSPLGQGADNTGPSAAVPLGPDGSYSLELKSVGKHRVIVSPSDLPYPVRPGHEYKYDLTPTEHDVKAGDNVIDVPLKPLRK
ncbi:hypothetical protein [Gemmata sp.]|uniref:hypothetical protein n=1 Tax=Gemmata sp. TaxID=1914242 RepID=UPI003F72DA5D